jgi:hypothetical protein
MEEPIRFITTRRNRKIRKRKLAAKSSLVRKFAPIRRDFFCGRAGWNHQSNVIER